ncbi:Homoserine/homoserine lactone efflux protein [Pseudodesulfovibrio hydrargyri]|uniref:Homoserine/homoserine lactone efflux protein n=1 Tax=Pseudodesulfovibrio hydrargyri TaxID=2125990 RepID=A0A1J5NE32_9BACT|nr:LysE family translocator [Pseudodesulfovibrio hydrargyri]OIQ49961.1 Homoserine/homoserine lactone efflux protein [Pseudodesulfovibrio hydrargyri]
MFGVHDFVLFVLSGLLLNITPGQDVFYIVSRGASHGWRIGSVAALGVGTGCFVHVFAAALGLSAILATSAMAFSVVKYAGAAYLIWVGLTMWRKNGDGHDADNNEFFRVNVRKIYSQGFWTNALNPKVALFFMAFLPQFVATDAPNKPLAFLLLGVVFTINGTLVNLAYAWSAAHVSARLGKGGSFGTWAKRAAGTLFIGLGIRLAMSDPVS